MSFLRFSALTRCPSWISMFLFFSLCSVAPLCAQDGWELLAKNDHVRAEQIFRQRLAQDSLDESALKGMILLSDIRGNTIAFMRFLKRYISTYWDASAYEIYRSVIADLDYEYDTDTSIYKEIALVPYLYQLIDNSPLTESAKVDIRLSIANIAQSQCLWEKQDSILQTQKNKSAWSYIGPFASGTPRWDAVDYPIAHEAYFPDSVYHDNAGMEFRWKKFAPKNSFASLHLPKGNTSESNIFFANTFLELSESGIVQLRLRRTAPLSIYVDDAFLYSWSDPTCACTDGEIVQLSLSSGVHRILVQISPQIPKGFGENPFGNEFNFFAIPDECPVESQTFSLRCTDTTGRVLSNARFLYSGNYAPTSHTATIVNHSELNQIKTHVSNNPNDLFSCYLLCRSYIRLGRTKEGEEYFAEAISAGQDNAVMRILLAQLYAWNGKREKIYEVLKTIDRQRSPFFQVLQQQLRSQNRETEKKAYGLLLDSLYQLAPTNPRTTDKYFRFNSSTWSAEQKDRFIDTLIASDSWFSWYRWERSDVADSIRNVRNEAEKKKKTLPIEFLQQIGWFKVDDDENAEIYSDAEIEFLADLLEKGPLSKERMDSLYTDFMISCKKDFNQFQVLQKYYSRKQAVDTVVALYDALLEKKEKALTRETEAAFLLHVEEYERAVRVLQDIMEGEDQSYDPTDIYSKLGNAWLGLHDTAQAIDAYQRAVATDQTGRTKRTNWKTNEETNEQEELPSVINKLATLLRFEESVPSFESYPEQENLLPHSQWESYANGSGSLLLSDVYNALIDTLGMSIKVWRKMTIALVNEGGAAWWTEHQFNEFDEVKSVKVIKALGGEMIPDKEQRTVVFKNLKPGDIICIEGYKEWSYYYSQPPEELSYYFSLAVDAPTVHAGVEFLVPAGTYLGHRFANLPDNPVTTRKGRYDSYRWEFTNLEKDIEEKGLLDGSDVHRTLWFSTLPDWSKVADWYLNEIYDRRNDIFREVPEIRRVLDSIIVEGMTDTEKIEAVYNFITRTINYSNVGFLQYSHTPQPPGKTLSACVGDCKDVATLMIAMLRPLGIESCLTLVRTHHLDYRKPLPGAWFNHAIVAARLDGDWKYMDLTTDFYPHYTLPNMDAGSWALRAREGETDIFQLPFDNIDADKNLTEIDSRVQIDTSRTVSLDVRTTYHGIKGGDWREALSDQSREEAEQKILAETAADGFTDLRLTGYSFENPEELTPPLRAHYTFAGNGFGNRSGESYIFRVPYIVQTSPSIAMQTLRRHYRLDVNEVCSASPTHERITIVFPSGYGLNETPKDVRIQSPFGLYQLTFTQTDTGMIVEKHQVFYVDRILPEEFEEFRSFYSRILDADQTHFVLFKRGS